MAEGIERSAIVLICATRKYMERLAMDGSNNGKLEFDYAHKNRTPLCMLPVVVEESVTDTAPGVESWAWCWGIACIVCKLTSDLDADFDCAVAKIAESVDKVLQNEIQSAASAMT